jgi:hypothetical protein
MKTIPEFGPVTATAVASPGSGRGAGTASEPIGAGHVARKEPSMVAGRAPTGKLGRGDRFSMFTDILALRAVYG